jgi:diguanylate cyclase (GGDEF)-like protein
MPDGPRSGGAAVLAYLESRPSRTVWLAVAGTVTLVLVADLVTSSEVEVGAFYLVPIFLATWRFGRLPGLLTAAACAALWLGIDWVERSYTFQYHELWNAVFQFGTFLTFSAVSAALRTALEDQRMLALTDPLTGAANRRAFENRAQVEIARCARALTPLTVVLLDVDLFKSINDRYGHPAGDRLLCEVVRAVTDELRGTDLVARLGGDEFAILLSETSYDEAEGALRKLEGILRDRTRSAGWDVTFSIGAITASAPPESVSGLLADVDELLYRAKDGGRNRTLHSLRKPGSGAA